MLNDEQKLQYFADVTISEAEEISRGIIDEVTQMKAKRLTEIENEIQQAIYDFIQGEIAKIRRKNTLEFSQMELELRQTLLKRREEISHIVYSAVHDKLVDFTDSAEYKQHLLDITTKALGVIGYNCDLYVSVKDSAMEGELLEHIAKLRHSDDGLSGIHVAADKNIKIGGIRFYERERGLLINETLDDKLDKSKDSFGKLIGPILKR